MRSFVAAGGRLPHCSAPISQAVSVNGVCYLSGQLATDIAGNLVAGSARDEARLALENLVRVLQVAGYEVEEIVYLDVALIDLDDLPAVNELFENFFPGNRRPARTVYQAAGLPYGGRVKIQGIAAKDLVVVTAASTVLDARAH